MLGLIDRADVFAEDPTTGRYTLVLATDVHCRLAHVNQQPAATGAERAELGALRNLLWEPGVELPEGCQVLVDDVRWNAVTGTFRAMRGPLGTVVYRQCDVVRAPNG